MEGAGVAFRSHSSSLLPESKGTPASCSLSLFLLPAPRVPLQFTRSSSPRSQAALPGHGLIRLSSAAIALAAISVSCAAWARSQ
jgi:hypothetical protein